VASGRLHAPAALSPKEKIAGTVGKETGWGREPVWTRKSNPSRSFCSPFEGICVSRMSGNSFLQCSWHTLRLSPVCPAEAPEVSVSLTFSTSSVHCAVLWTLLVFEGLRLKSLKLALNTCGEENLTCMYSMYVCMYVCVCVCARARVCVYAEWGSARARVCVYAEWGTSHFYVLGKLLREAPPLLVVITIRIRHLISVTNCPLSLFAVRSLFHTENNRWFILFIKRHLQSFADIWPILMGFSINI